jgi:HEAT repeat protein
MRTLLFLLFLAIAAAAADRMTIDQALAVAKAGPEAARERIPGLIELGKGGPKERFAARDALVIAGPHAIAPLVQGAAGDGSLRLLLEGVSHDLGAAVVAPALPLLGSDDAKIRAAAAISLGAAGEGGEAAVKKLIEALYDKDGDVRREAATALGTIGRGSHDATPALILLANDRERDATRVALLALGSILRDAAERARPVPDVPPEVKSAIEKGVKWLAAHQRPDGRWHGQVFAPETDEAVDARLTSVALLALMEDGTPDHHLPAVRSGLRYLVVTAPPGVAPTPGSSWRRTVGTMAASHSVAARTLKEPECSVAAERVTAALANMRPQPGDNLHTLAWRALAFLEASFAGIPVPPAESADGPEYAPPELALVGISEGKLPDDALRASLAAYLREEEPGSDDSLDFLKRWSDSESWFFATRALFYAGVKVDSAAICKRQRADGSWGEDGDPAKTALMVLCLETASGLAHPLTMPLPDAPQLKAAVATLKVAALSQEPEIRAAAEQALAGFR